MDEAISHSTKKEEGVLLTIFGDTEVGEPCVSGKKIYLPVFYCLCYGKDISTDMLEEKVAEDRYLELNE